MFSQSPRCPDRLAGISMSGASVHNLSGDCVVNKYKNKKNKKTQRLKAAHMLLERNTLKKASSKDKKANSELFKMTIFFINPKVNTPK